MEPSPSVGRIVHYCDPMNYGSPLPAIVTYVHHPFSVDLFVIGRYGTEHRSNIPFTATPNVSGTWSWPPRVP